MNPPSPSASPDASAATGLLAKAQARGFRLTTGLSLLVIFITMCVVFSLLSPYFLTVDNFVNITKTLPVVGIIAIGETLVLLEVD